MPPLLPGAVARWIFRQAASSCRGTSPIAMPVRLVGAASDAGTPATILDMSGITSTPINANNEGYTSVKDSLAHDAASGSTSIELASVSGLAAGDYVKLVDNFEIEEGTSGLYKQGEIHEITNIAGDTLNLNAPLFSTYKISRSAYVQKLNMISGVDFTNLAFTGPGENTGPYCMQLYLCDNAQLNNCDFSTFGNGAVGLVDCLNTTVKNCTFSDIFMTGLGYAVCVVNASDNINITGCSFIAKGRHYIDTGSTSGDDIEGGFAKRINISNCDFQSSTDYAVHTHATFDGTMTISGCKFANDGGAVQFTNGTDIVTNCTVDNCPGSIGFVGGYNLYSSSCQVTDCTIENSEDGVQCETSNIPSDNPSPNPPYDLLTVSGTTFIGSPVKVTATIGDINGVLINNNTFSGISYPIQITGSNYAVNNITISNNQVQNGGNDCFYLAAASNNDSLVALYGNNFTAIDGQIQNYSNIQDS